MNRKEGWWNRKEGWEGVETDQQSWEVPRGGFEAKREQREEIVEGDKPGSGC